MTTAEGEVAFVRWRANPTTAVIAFHDDSAIEFLMAAARSGVRVPEDVSVIGVDDLPLSGHVYPRLTTVAVAADVQCAAAMQQLSAMLQRARPQTPPIAPLYLVVRESTGPAPA